jgi:hypothetical protein
MRAKPVRSSSRAAQARALFGAGAALRVVLRACGVRQVEIAKRIRLDTPRVSLILGSPEGARKQGKAASLKVYRTAAAMLGLSLADIPEARPFTTSEEEPPHEDRPRQASNAH